MQSMSGFGQGKAKGPEGTITVEIKAVNYRFFELRPRLPLSFMALESRIKDLLKKKIARGMLTLFVNWEGTKKKTVTIDSGLVKEYYKKLETLRKKLGLKERVEIPFLASLPGVIQVEEPQGKADKVWPLLNRALAEALRGLLSMKQREGRAIRDDFRKRLRIIEGELKFIKKRSPQVVMRYRRRLAGKTKQVSFCTGKSQLDAEVAAFSERTDISEELTRLGSLLGQFRDTFKGKGVKGRKLEFIFQELHREVNTIGAKSPDALISRRVIKLKGELEKIRESVQNVE